jgi:peptidyl-prolyl cis-trans isomerase C
MRRQLYALAIATALCSLPALAAEDYTLMQVNDQKVSKSEADAMWLGMFPPGQAPALEQMDAATRDKVLRGIMTERLLLSEATKAGIDKSPEVAKQLEDVKRKLVVRQFLENKTAGITDADLKKEYDALVLSLRGKKEVRARHILVASEQEAKDIEAKLKEGKKFEDLAREYSKDPGSAKQGGDLGYFTQERMVKEFADKAFSMKKGEVSDPVKSQFGWHVIKVEDSRAITVPTYNAVKEQLRGQLEEEKLGDYVKGLVKGAEVKVYDAKGKEQPFDKNITETKK